MNEAHGNMSATANGKNSLQFNGENLHFLFRKPIFRQTCDDCATQQWRSSDIPAVRMYAEGLVSHFSKNKGNASVLSTEASRFAPPSSLISASLIRKPKCSVLSFGMMKWHFSFSLRAGSGSWSWFMSRCRTYLIWQVVTTVFYTSQNNLHAALGKTNQQLF